MFIFFYTICRLIFLLADNIAWEQLIALYPYLVECTTTTSTQVSRPLREALLQFCDLLQPPNTSKPLTNGIQNSNNNC